MIVYLLNNPFTLPTMKKITIFISTICLLVIFSCSTENLSNEEIAKDSNFEVSETIKDYTQSTIQEESCITVNLIAGQHYTAGAVTLDIDGENLIITFSTNSDWSIKATHLSVGNCDDDSIPVTNSGNPKVGNFEYSAEHADGTNEVVYIISLAGLGDNICFAAHAEVVGPDGEETAWAEGTEFAGNGWAMYVETSLENCDENDDV